eukprot:15166212-Ditylum_brightwellii.AAC.2
MMKESNTTPSNKSQKPLKFAEQDATQPLLAQAAPLLAEVKKKAVKPVIKQYVRAKDNSSNKKDNKNVNK